MDAEEKLMALKNAYADIILNTSREAALRVMSSERRAVQHQHELNVAKDESLRMLMRLKQMMDFRTIEAEVVALNQQKKIEVLEAQLHEAEDIVEELREKLGKLQDEMKRIKKEKSMTMDESNNASSNEMDIGVYSHQSGHPNSADEFAIKPDAPELLSQHNECSKCHQCKKACTCDSYSRNHDLPSIISRNKEPALYRNGCTQRILACEGTDKLTGTNSNETRAVDVNTVKAPSLADVELSSFPPLTRKRKRASKQRNIARASTKRTAEENTHSSEDLSEAAEDGGLNKREMNSEGLQKFDVGSNSSEVIRKHGSERVIKYTFQRRRKRGALSGCEVKKVSEPEVEKKVEEKKDGQDQLEPSKSCLLVESSRDSRRLAQVARQLISLSEKKWWS